MRTGCVIILLWWSMAGNSQGNNCSNAYDLTLDAVCRSYAVSSSTGSSILCSYNGGPGRVTFFRFTTDSSPQCVLLDVTASSVVTMELVLYDGCSSGTASPTGGMYNHGMCMDLGKGLWAQNLFDNLLPNTTYYLRVRTENGYSGNLQVCGKYTTPANDICSGAMSIGTTPVVDNNACHTPGPGVPASQLCAITLENTAWYTYVVQNNGSSIITIDNIECNNGSGNNNNGFQIGFFTGTCGSLTPITCSDGAGGTVTASASGLVAGSRIYVAVDGYSGSNCSYRISASNAEPLPVRLKEFTGWKTASKNILKWITVEETENDYFEVQRSDDGRNYTALGRLKGQLSSQAERQYFFEDLSPLQKAYYRLKQVDLDGKFTFSKVIEISREAIASFDLLSASMAFDRLNLTIKSSQRRKVQVSVVDVQGRLVKADWVNCDAGLTVVATPITALPAGQYYAVVSYDREKALKAFWKGNMVH